MKRYALIGVVVLASSAAGQDMPLSQVLIPGEGWAVVPTKFGVRALEFRISGVTADPDGTPLVAMGKAVWKLTKDGLEKVVDCGSGFPLRISCGHDGTLYAIEAQKAPLRLALSRLTPSREAKKIVDGAWHVAISPQGVIYYVAPSPTTGKGTEIQFDRPSSTPPMALYRLGSEKPLLRNVGIAGGMVFWRDGGTLVVDDPDGDKLFTYRVGKDGGLDAKEGYYTLRTCGREPTGVAALTLDTDGRLYAATALGVQVFDPTGRMCGVINPPARKPVTAMAFAGPGRDQLYVVCDGKLFVRKTKVKGFVPAAKKP